MIDLDNRGMAAKHLTDFIKKNPASSNIIMTSSKFLSRWEKLVMKQLQESDVKFMAPAPMRGFPIVIEGNENKHHPTVKVLSFPGRDIVGQRVTGVLLLDMFFLRETPDMRRMFTENIDLRHLGEAAKKAWLKKNTPLTFYMATHVFPVLSSDAQVWTVGQSEDCPPYVLDSILPNRYNQEKKEK